MGFEGINPYEYQKAAVALQKERIAAQPHLQPQIERVANLPPITGPRVEPGGPVPQGQPRGRTSTGGEVGPALVGLGIGAAVELGNVAKETVKTIVNEGLKTVAGGANTIWR